MTVVGDDGLARPPWASRDPLLRDYYDTEWGMPVRDERGLFERLSLEAFQSGLSWATILRKRPAFRRAFDGFDPDLVAGYGEAEVARLLGDPGIVRNRRKIEATIGNARATVALRRVGGLADLVWSFRPDRTPAPTSYDEVPVPVSGVRGAGGRAAQARVRLRRTHHDVRADGGRRCRGHPCGGQPPPGLVRRVAAWGGVSVGRRVPVARCVRCPGWPITGHAASSGASATPSEQEERHDRPPRRNAR